MKLTYFISCLRRLIRSSCSLNPFLGLMISICLHTGAYSRTPVSEGQTNKKEIIPSEKLYAPLKSIPAPLANLKGVHPRMFMTAESRRILKSKMTSQPYSGMLEKLKVHADKSVKAGTPAYRPGSGYDEQLWQREVGNAIPELAMAFCMTGEEKYFTTAKNYMLAAASYPTWGIGDIDNTDLATGHLLFGMSVGYDWLWSDLDATSRDSIRNCLVKRGERLYDLLSTGKVWWHKSYLHNHQHVTMGGLAAAGFALYGENPGIDKWILLCDEKFKQAIISHPPDGGWHEGIPYSGYGIEYMMKYMALSQDLLGANLFKGSPFFKNIADFRIEAMIPFDYWKISKSTLMSIGDGPRVDWYGPDYLLRKLASEFKDGYAQWLAEKIDFSEYSSFQALFLNILWVNPSVKPKSPASLPLFKHYKDLDITYMRSGWDGKESVSMFKCGPPIGHHATTTYTYDPYGGHNHPDVGMFQIFSHGDWLITDEGYAWKRTIYQNTLVVNGIGQIGEGRWGSSQKYIGAKDLPSIVYTISNKSYDYIIGNAKPAYLPSSHLSSFYRHILYLKPDCWVIADEAEADTTSLFEIYYHSNFPFLEKSNNCFTASGTRGSMTLTVLKPEDSGTSAFLQDIDGTGGGVASRLNTLKVSSKGKSSDLFITVIEAYASGETATIKPSVSYSSTGSILKLASEKRTKNFKIMTGRKDKNTPLFIETK